MDLMYPIGHGSKFADIELKYSLRSVEKHLTGIERVFIVGRLPKWINKDSVHFIPYQDKGKKQFNIYSKINAAIVGGISEWFLFMNDDHFLLEDLKANELPYYYENTTEYWFNKYEGKNKVTTGNTPPGNFFDIHCPIIYGCHVFKNTVGKLDWKKEYLIKSSYCNMMGIKGEPLQDLKIRTTKTYEEIKELIKYRKFFSIGDYDIYPAMKRVLNELYPNKSRFEI